MDDPRHDMQVNLLGTFTLLEALPIALIVLLPPRGAIDRRHQTAGRGRLDRSWETPALSSLTFSVLLRPDLAGTKTI